MAPYYNDSGPRDISKKLKFYPQKNESFLLWHFEEKHLYKLGRDGVNQMEISWCELFPSSGCWITFLPSDSCSSAPSCFEGRPASSAAVNRPLPSLCSSRLPSEFYQFHICLGSTPRNSINPVTFLSNSFLADGEGQLNHREGKLNCHGNQLFEEASDFFYKKENYDDESLGIWWLATLRRISATPSFIFCLSGKGTEGQSLKKVWEMLFHVWNKLVNYLSDPSKVNLTQFTRALIMGKQHKYLAWNSILPLEEMSSFRDLWEIGYLDPSGYISLQISSEASNRNE